MTKHIILMILDCLRQDYAYNPKFMPFLNKLKNKSIWYEEAYAIAPATSFAMSSILTGKKPLEIENDWKITKKKQQYYLPNKLPGFHKMFITGNVMTCRKYGYNNGFDYFEDFLNEDFIKRREFNEIFTKVGQKIKMPLIQQIGKKTYYFIQKHVFKDPNINVEAKIRFPKIMQSFFRNINTDKNTLSILHFIDPHAPYLSVNQKDAEIIKKTKRLTRKVYDCACNDFRSDNISSEEITFLLQRYEEELKDLDCNLKIFIDKIKEKLKWEDTLLIITADHGEAFGETGYLTHPLNRVSNIHHIKVPLIFSGGLINKIELPEKNNLIWNKDIYDIIKNVIHGEKTELKEHLLAFGLKKLQGNWIICSTYNVQNKKILETNTKTLQENSICTEATK